MQADRLPPMLLVSADACTPGEVRSAVSWPFELIEAYNTDLAKLLLRSGRRVDVAILDSGISQGQCIDFLRFVNENHPHIQCVVACLDGDVEKLVGVKNTVTRLSAIRLPWASSGIGDLCEDLLIDAQMARRQEAMLWASLVEEQRHVRTSRMAMCHQSFAVAPELAARLTSFFKAATKAQPKEVPVPLADFDTWVTAQTEARRMVAVIAHVREWSQRFEDRPPKAEDLPQVFECSGGLVRVKDIQAQLEVINGASDTTPKMESCGLLAYLLKSEPGQALGQQEDGSWALQDLGPEEVPENWLKAILLQHGDIESGHSHSRAL